MAYTGWAVTYVLAASVGGRLIQERREGLLLLVRPLRQLRTSDELALRFLHLHQIGWPERVKPMNSKLIIN